MTTEDEQSLKEDALYYMRNNPLFKCLGVSEHSQIYEDAMADCLKLLETDERYRRGSDYMYKMIERNEQRCALAKAREEARQQRFYQSVHELVSIQQQQQQQSEVLFREHMASVSTPNPFVPLPPQPPRPYF